MTIHSVTTTKKQKYIKGLVFALGCSAVMGTLSPVSAQQGGGQPSALVEVSTASKENMAPQVYVPGTVISKNDSRVAAEIAGRVIWVAPEGTQLKEGDVIATIDDSSILLTKGRNEAQVKRLEARIEYLKADLKRFEELAETSHTPVSRVEEARSTLVMTEQELAQARIAVKQSEVDLARTKVRAPFPGRVVERLAQAGEYSAPGRQIVRLVDTEHLEISARAPVNLSATLNDGQNVMVQDNNVFTDTRIRAIVPVGDGLSRAMEIRVNVPAGKRYAVGSALQVGLPKSAPEEVIAVPRDALVLRTDGTYVFRVDAESKAERLRVTTGAASGNRVAVLGGIENGDRVIVRGGERLRPGQSVELKGETGAVSVADAARATGD
ncbi:hemolysin D [Kordiimonas sediminis]|uniref:Hemolysin D n=1 Tax=Kordiimonas sediminis TaxID=1735581 RepID=A0A919AXK5_9PROT|nr:efflux RND transporter periplasmic adaptor subunit [Kordiimonas sediminis]GHF29949.1 hemolysin D [Kordiimonas sediminis]